MSSYPTVNIWTLGEMTATGYVYFPEEKLYIIILNIGASQVLERGSYSALLSLNI